MALTVTGAEFRLLVRGRMTVNAFTERVAAVYMRDHGIEEKSAVRQVKRWFSADYAEKRFRPREDWRVAISEVLGDDPFAGPSPLERIERRLDELAAMVLDSDRERLSLRRRVDALEAQRAQPGPAPTADQSST